MAAESRRWEKCRLLLCNGMQCILQLRCFGKTSRLKRMFLNIVSSDRSSYSDSGIL